jgi:ribosomal protein L37E
MTFYSLGQLSNSEKNNILNKHKELYNGYRQVNQPVSNEQPLYVQDFAGDKNGITVNGSGDVTGYSNKIYMKESEEKMCSECGGMMYEGECSECGYGKMEEECSVQQIIEGIKNYSKYTPQKINENIILYEPNLYDQPKYYQNTEFFSIKPEEIIYC